MWAGLKRLSIRLSNRLLEISQNGEEKVFQDEMLHRAFSRSEMKQLLEENGFLVLDQGDNFDETSFYTVAEKR